MLLLSLFGLLCLAFLLFAASIVVLRNISEISAFDFVTRFFLPEDPEAQPDYFEPATSKEKTRTDVLFEYETCKYLYQSKLFYQIVPIRRAKGKAGEAIIEKKERYRKLSRVERLKEKRELFWEDLKETGKFVWQLIRKRHPGVLHPHPISKLIELYSLDFLLEGFEEYHNNASDHGADILASYGTKLVLFQCKYVSNAEDPIPPSELNDAIAGKEFYRADYACVITNSTFSRQTQDTALYFDIFLLDKEVFDLLKKAYENKKDAELGIKRDALIEKRLPYTPGQLTLYEMAQRLIYRKRKKNFKKRKTSATKQQATTS